MLVRPSRRTIEAFVAACFEVTRFGDFVCESALPPADFDFAPVPLLVIVFEALDAAFRPVVRAFAAISFLSWWRPRRRRIA